MYCDVASGFNFQIEHFLHLYRVEREKVTLRNIIQSDPKKTGPNSNYSKYTGPVFFWSPCMIQTTMKKVWLACVQRYLLNLPYKRMLRHRSALKKKQLVVHQSKKNADCADITKIKDEKIQTF